ncbi:hypothetical protein HMP0721_2242 [Pseudoramibacter alactolyticus ATCC 23263]|uniref:Uncharacterized protein n=1 Tax=Pseudoramibacter alactolyticus ATCC 23263 TaxID=887929 RepID=E6MJQ7_9FIRM|nr:hypothetical protein HMP0721_2242 [Pseudoramibacter alactolyticus ATCC 23263]
MNWVPSAVQSLYDFIIARRPLMILQKKRKIRENKSGRKRFGELF